MECERAHVHGNQHQTILKKQERYLIHGILKKTIKDGVSDMNRIRAEYNGQVGKFTREAKNKSIQLGKREWADYSKQEDKFVPLGMARKKMRITQPRVQV
jgi:hypothetical protein